MCYPSLDVVYGVGGCVLYPCLGFCHHLPQQSHYGRVKTCPGSQVWVWAALQHLCASCCPACHPSRDVGQGKRWCTVPIWCPNTFLYFMSLPELWRLHCSREEAEEWAAPQIVSVPAAPAPQQVQGVQQSQHPTACCGVDESGWIPGHLPSARLWAVGWREAAPGVRKMAQLLQGKGVVGGTCSYQGNQGREGSAPPGRCAFWSHTDACFPLPRRHLRSSLRRGTRSSAAPWATTTVSHALLGNFEVTAPTQ